MKNLIKLCLSALLFVTLAACDDANKVDYVPPVKITFEGVGENNIVEIPKGATSYTASISITATSKIRAMSMYEANVKTGAKGNKIAKDTVFNPILESYSFEYVITGITENKAILIEVEEIGRAHV